MDSYQWLENIESSESLNFVNQANSDALKRLTQHPKYFQFYQNSLEIFESEEKPLLGEFHNGYFYSFQRSTEKPRGVWKRTPSQKLSHPDWEVVLDFESMDPEWTFSYAHFSKFRPELCLINLSFAGKDTGVIREFNLFEKNFTGDFHSELSKSHGTYVDENTILFNYGNNTESGYPGQVYRWRRGEALKDSELIFKVNQNSMAAYGWCVEHEKQSYEVFENRVDFYNAEYSVYWKNELVRLPLSTAIQISTIDEAKVYYSYQRNDQGALEGSIWIYNLETQENSLFMNPPLELYPQLVWYFDSQFYISGLKNIRYSLFQTINGQWSEIVNDQQASLNVFGLDYWTKDIFLNETSYLKPAKIYQFKQAQFKELKTEHSFFNSEKLQIKHFSCKSDDGTEIPYTVLGQQDSTAKPTILYGYGGFLFPITPSYRPMIGKNWLEEGGLYVFAHIRGGSEFGADWHTQALKLNRKKCYEDFKSVAQDLVQRGVTTQEQLGIWGGSNGGLLVTATMTLFPDVCKAVCCEVPLIDMERYHLLLAGKSWAAEYGTVEDSVEMADYLRSYSPFQNVKKDIKYPSVFFTTSTYDDRVHPGHARKMYAKMKSMGHDVFYYEEKEGGHGGNVPPKTQAQDRALIWSFIYSKLFNL